MTVKFSNREKFEEDIQDILKKFAFGTETRRQIFSQIMEYADQQDQQTTEKAIPNDKTSESSESDA